MGYYHLYTFFTFKRPRARLGKPRLCDLYMGFGFRQNPQYEKGGLSVKSNRCLMTFKDADPLGSAFEMSKGVMKLFGGINPISFCSETK